MANVLYSEARAQMLAGGLDWTSDSFTFSVFDDLYTPVESHTWDNVVARVIASSSTFPSRSITPLGAAAVSGPITIAGVTTPVNRRVGGIILHRTMDDLLIAAYDTGLTGFASIPFTPVPADNVTYYVLPNAVFANALFRP